MTHTARCACARSSITLSGAPTFHAVCHCTNCKLRTGSAFGVSAYFRRTDIVAQAGPTTVYAMHNPHRNEDQERHFCAACGTTLFWYASTSPDLVGIAAGCFGEDQPGTPRASFTHARKLPWVELPASWKTVQE